MAKRRSCWRRVWLEVYKGRSIRYRIYRHNPQTGNRQLVRTFLNRRLARAKRKGSGRVTHNTSRRRGLAL
jgi:hypothetical protein